MHGIYFYAYIASIKFETMNAKERYNSQDQDGSSKMQKPILTNNGRYVWETWTFKNEAISSIRYFTEDEKGGNTMRISIEDFIYFTS